MPVVAEKKEKQYRMDIRPTQLRRMGYERAASLQGQTLTQWATVPHDESARRDIDEAMAAALSLEAFDTFRALLDAPMPEAAQNLLARKPVWE